MPHMLICLALGDFAFNFMHQVCKISDDIDALYRKFDRILDGNKIQLPLETFLRKSS